MHSVVTPRLTQTNVAIISCLAFALLVASLFMPALIVTILFGLLAIAAVALAPQLGLTLLVPSLFFEADAYSVTLPFGRVRLYHILIAILFARLVFDLLTGKRKWRKTPLDIPLVVYLAINWLAVYVAPDLQIAGKIAGLITLLALLYWTITNYIQTREQFTQIAKLFLWSTVAIALFGLFQVFAVWFAGRFDITLWNGAIIHSDILPDGRPYATFVEAGWYGAVMAAAFAGATILSFSKAFRRHQVELLVVSLILLVATLLSEVRGGWIAAAIALPAMLLVNRFKLKLLDTKLLANVTATVVILAGLALVFTPAIREALITRLSTLGTSSTLQVEPRFLIMQDGWDLFVKHPYVGRGPGAYTSLGTIPFVTERTAAIHGIENFQTNAILTILIDTGLVGLAVFVWLMIRASKTAWRALRAKDSQVDNPDAKTRAILFALATAGLTLALGYQVSTGIWLGLTWFVLSLIISGSLIGAPRHAMSSKKV